MRRVVGTLIGVGIYGLLIMGGSLLYMEPLPVSWPHEQDTPMVRLDDSEQWVCVVDGTPGAWGFCSQASLDEDLLEGR